jgi:hypothetical protein
MYYSVSQGEVSTRGERIRMLPALADRTKHGWALLHAVAAKIELLPAQDIESGETSKFRTHGQSSRVSLAAERE